MLSPAVLLCLVAAGGLEVVLSLPVKGELEQSHGSPDPLLLQNLLKFFKRVQSQPSDANCPDQPQPVPLPSPLPEDVVNALKELDSVASSTVNSTSVPGVIISVTYNGQTLWTKGYGTKNKSSTEVPPDSDSIFRIGSVSKIFPVLMLYRMYEQGSIKSLDDPLAMYEPDFKILNPIPYSKELITLRQMASQMSGLPREAPCGIVTNISNLCPFNSSVILERLSYQYSILPPWTKPSYSNLAYALLGRLLSESVAKMEFEDYIQTTFLTPLNLTSTGFTIDDRVKSQMAVGYEPDGSVAPLYDLGWVGPAGQMYSTIQDLNKLAQFFYNASISVGADILGQSSSTAETVLSSGLRREMQLPMYVNPDGLTGFGTPWEIAFVGNYTVRTKGGNVDGYSALFSFIPELKLSINALFSGSFGETLFVVKVYNTILPGLVSYLNNHQPSIPLPPDPSLYEGVYNGSGLIATIQMTNGALILTFRSLGGQSVYLAYREYAHQMQVYYPESLLPCLTTELTASWEEWVYFDYDEQSGKTRGFTIPGIGLPYYWKREN